MTIEIMQVTSQAARDPKVVAVADGIKVAWKVRTADRDGRRPRYVGWTCPEHGNGECVHTEAVEALLHDSILDRLQAMERRG